MPVTDDPPPTLVGMETAAPGHPTRQFVIPLGHGRFMQVNFTVIETQRRHGPCCATPTNHEINRSITALSSARLLP